MMMQSNEAFSRVDQGMSPMTAGMLSGLALGGASAGYQGLQYLSYTGIQKRHDELKEGVKSLQGELAETSATKTKTGMSLGDRVKDIKLAGQGKLENYRRNVAAGEAAETLRDIKGNKNEVKRIAQKRQGGPGSPVIIDMPGTTVGGGPRMIGGGSQNLPSTFVNTPTPLTRGEQATWDKYGNRGSAWSTFRDQRSKRDAHVENINQIKGAREYMRGEREVENKEYKKINNKLQNKQKALESFDLKKQQEAHRVHGKSFGNAAMKSGAFAAGGFLLGAGVQMAVNSTNN